MSPAPRLLAGPEMVRAHTVFFVETPVLWGGPQKRLFRLARAWSARGYPTAIASLRGDEHSDPSELERLGLPVLLLTEGGKEVLKSFRMDAARAVRALVASLEPRLAFAMETLVDYQVRLGLARSGIPVVTLLGIDRWKWERRPFRAWIARALARRPGAVVGNSRRCLEGWKRVLGGRRFEIVPHAVIPNPVDPAEIEPLFERDHGDRLVAGGLGRFEPQKGFDLLVRAFALLPERIGGKPVHLRLQGRGREEGALRALAQDIGIAERVELVPFSRAIEPFLHSLDVLVVPSRWSGFENVALEGILSGTPTLCSRGTGLDELPPDRSLSFFDLDPEGLARSLRATLELSPADRAALARAQRAFVTRELDLHVIAARFETFLAGAGLLEKP